MMGSYIYIMKHEFELDKTMETIDDVVDTSAQSCDGLNAALARLTNNPLFQHYCVNVFRHGAKKDIMSLIDNPIDYVKNLISKGLTQKLTSNLSDIYEKSFEQISKEGKELYLIDQMVDTLIEKDIPEVTKFFSIYPRAKDVVLEQLVYSLGSILFSEDNSPKRNNGNYQVFDLNLPKTNLVQYDALSIPKIKGNSGDVVYVEELNDNEILFALCDVAGKGRSVKMYSDLIKSSIANSVNKHDPAKLATDVSSQLSKCKDDFGTGLFSTGAFLVYDKRTDQVKYSTAGDQIYVLSKDGQFNQFDSGSGLMYIDDEFSPKFETKTMSAKNIQRIVLMTDGIYEGRKDLQTGKYLDIEPTMPFVDCSKNPTQILSKVYDEIRVEHPEHPFDDTSAIVIDFYK